MEFKTPAFALTLLLAVATISAAAPPDVLDRQVSVDLQDVTAAEAFSTLARVAGVWIDVEGLAGRKVTLKQENAPVKALLTTLCESLDCRWKQVDDTPARFKVVPLPSFRMPGRITRGQAALWYKIDLQATEADVRDLFEKIAQLISTRAFVAPAVHGTVTLDLEQTTIEKILDTLCETAACT